VSIRQAKILAGVLDFSGAVLFGMYVAEALAKNIC